MPLSDDAKARLMAMGTRGRTAESVAGQLNEEPIANPLDEVQYTGDLEADTLAEFDALLAALETAADRVPPDWMHTSRSAIWVCLVFLTRQDKEWFLITTRMFEAGDKYLAIEDWEYGLAQTAKQGPAEAQYSTWKAPVWTTNTDGEPITAKQLAFRQAAARARYDMQMLGDSETWLCLCFRTERQREQWLSQHPPIEGTQYHDGYTVAESVGITIPVEEV